MSEMIRCQICFKIMKVASGVKDWSMEEKRSTVMNWVLGGFPLKSLSTFVCMFQNFNKMIKR